MKEWKKPCMEVVVLDERDVIATSSTNQNQEISIDDGAYHDETKPNPITGTNNWGR